MSILKRLMIVAVIMALFCAWTVFAYANGRHYEWIIAAAYSGFVVASLAIVVFIEEISRMIK